MLVFSPLTAEQRATEDAIVVFELKDKDFLRSRFLAEAFLPFSAIPESSPDSAMESLDQIHLKLSRPTRKSTFQPLSVQKADSLQQLPTSMLCPGTEVIEALEQRKGDNQAMYFLSKLNIKADRK